MHTFTCLKISSRHEKAAHGRSVEETTGKKIAPQVDSKMKEDYLNYNYHRGKLAFGLLLFSLTMPSRREMDKDCTNCTNLLFCCTKQMAKQRIHTFSCCTW